MELYSLGIIKGAAVVADRRKLGGEEVSRPFLSGGYFEFASDGILEGVGPGEVDPIVI